VLEEVANCADVGLEVVQRGQLTNPYLFAAGGTTETDTAFQSTVAADIAIKQNTVILIPTSVDKVLAQCTLARIFLSQNHETVVAFNAGG